MLTIQFRKVVCSILRIGFTSGEQVIVDHQNTVCYRHHSTFVATASSNLMILRREVAVLGSRCSIGSLNQHRFDPAIAEAFAPALAFASTLVVARTNPHKGRRGERHPGMPTPPS